MISSNDIHSRFTHVTGNNFLLSFLPPIQGYVYVCRRKNLSSDFQTWRWDHSSFLYKLYEGDNKITLFTFVIYPGVRKKEFLITWVRGENSPPHTPHLALRVYEWQVTVHVWLFKVVVKKHGSSFPTCSFCRAWVFTNISFESGFNVPSYSFP